MWELYCKKLPPACLTAKPIDFRLMSKDYKSTACSHQYIHLNLHEIRCVLDGLDC